MTRMLKTFIDDSRGEIAAEKVLLGALALATVVAVITASGADLSIFANAAAQAGGTSVAAGQ